MAQSFNLITSCKDPFSKEGHIPRCGSWDKDTSLWQTLFSPCRCRAGIPGRGLLPWLSSPCHWPSISNPNPCAACPGVCLHYSARYLHVWVLQASLPIVPKMEPDVPSPLLRAFSSPSGLRPRPHHPPIAPAGHLPQPSSLPSSSLPGSPKATDGSISLPFLGHHHLPPGLRTESPGGPLPHSYSPQCTLYRMDAIISFFFF